MDGSDELDGLDVSFPKRLKCVLFVPEVPYVPFLEREKHRSVCVKKVRLFRSPAAAPIDDRSNAVSGNALFFQQRKGRGGGFVLWMPSRLPGRFCHQGRSAG